MKKNKPSKSMKYMLGIFLIPLFLTIVMSGYAYSQPVTYSIKGNVTDLRTNDLLSGVSVHIQNTNISTTTNSAGEYTINAALSPGEHEITFTSVGYVPQSSIVSFGTNSVISVDMVMKEDLIGLDEVIVTGTSVATSRKQLGNAISTVSAKDISTSAATSIDQALSGKISGAQITQTSGNPAGSISVRLRGTSTVVGNAEPLYIIDGVVVNNSSPELLNLGGNSQSRLVDLNPADVDRIEIIKGAAAAAIYGSRASNGVVQIFTKRGKSGKPVVNFSGQFSVSELRKKLPYNTYPYMFNNTSSTDLSQTEVKRYDLQEMIFRSAIGTDNNISISGGNEQTQYFISGNFLKNQGIVDQTNFNRNGARISIDQRLGEKVKVSLGVNYVLSNSKDLPNGGISATYGVLTGFFMGNNHINPKPDPITGVYPSVSNPAVRRVNPLEAINNYDFNQKTSRLVGNIQVAANPIPGMNITYILGYDNATQIGTAYIPVDNTGPDVGGFSRRSDRTSFMLNNDLTFSYQTDLTDWLHSTTGLGATAQSEKVYQTGLSGSQLGLIGQTVNNAAIISSGESRSDINIYGAYLQQTFGIKNKIFLTGAARYDVSSVFGKEDRWQLYPKASGSYLLSNEEFWNESKLSEVISSFKIRGSYGQAGNLSAIGAYDRLSVYSPVSLPGLPGVISPSLFGNDKIKPERQTEIEFGSDISFLNDRVLLEFTYYKKNVEDLILNAQLAPSTGYNNQFVNIGSMENRGFEALLRLTPINKERFQWNAIATFSKNKNKVDNIPGGTINFAGGFDLVSGINGHPLGVFNAAYFARNEDGSLLLTPTGLPQIERTGPRDPATGQPTGAAGRKIIGDPNPDWIGSFINEFSIGKRFSFRAQLDASYGGDVFNFSRRNGDRDLYGGLKGYEKELKGEVPKGTSAALFGVFENWIENVSYVKLREVSVSYSVKPKFLPSNEVRLTLAGRNLISFDNYSGWDPEINTSGQNTAVRGFDFAEVPIPRTFVLGVNVTF